MATPPELRWGSHRARTIGDAILIIAGAVGVAGSTTTVIATLLIPGILVHIAGWCVMPSAGWRRVVAVVISTPTAILLLTGPKFIAVLVLAYIGWLLVQHRPARSYPTVIFVLAAAVILPRIYPDYDGMLPALALELAVIIGSAWAARAVAPTRGSRRPPEESR